MPTTESRAHTAAYDAMLAGRLYFAMRGIAYVAPRLPALRGGGGGCLLESAETRAARRSRAAVVLQMAYNAASVGDWRWCADCYAVCVVVAPRAWEWRWYAFSGFASLVAGEKRFAPSKADLKLLRRVADDADELCHFRAEAEFSLGLALWEAGDRDGAARHYRLALKRARAATPAERRAREKASASPQMAQAGHPSIFDKPVGDILDCTVDDARDNLGVLENAQSAAAIAFMQRPPALRCDGSVVPSEYRPWCGPPNSESDL